MKNQEHFITLDELAEKYLRPEINQSFPDVDIEVKKVVIKTVVEKFEFVFEIEEMTAATFLVGLTTLILLLLQR